MTSYPQKTISYNPSDRIRLEIQSFGSSGEGVGKHNGFTIFVDGALPGEIALIELIECKKNYAIGKLIFIEKTSPFRQKPICPLFGTCGGCQTMHLQYAHQLLMKKQKVIDALQRIGKIDPNLVADCEPSVKDLYYRNKIQLPVNQSLNLGLYKKGSHDIIEVEKCFIHCAIGENVFQKIKTLLKNFELSAYNPITKKGNIRHILIKSSLHSQKALVVIVTKQNNSTCLQPLAEAIMKNCPEVAGVIQNIHGEKENVILGKTYKCLKGEEKIFENLLGLQFSISAASFFQVNPKQAEKLYQKALEISQVSSTDRVLDAYCGVGTMSLIFAKKAKHVVGVEVVSQAIEDAKENAKINQIANVEFICQESENIIQKIKNIDLCIVNPPRKGCELKFLQGLVKLSPKKIIYISCEPATLARDLAILSELGFATKEIYPFDMFPQTAHVETIAKLERVKN